MKKVILFVALIASMFTLKVSAQRSKNDPTPIHSTKVYQQEEKNMDGVAKELAWGTGDVYEDNAQMIRQDTSVDPMASKEFSHGVMPHGKGMVMLKADAFNLAQMNNFFGYYKADYYLSKKKPNLFLFRHGYYFATYDDVRESYYFDYHPYALTSKDPILKKGCKVFWIDWSAITKEVKPINTVEIANQKHAVILSKEDIAKYLQALNDVDAKVKAVSNGTTLYGDSGGYLNHIDIDKKEDYPDGRVLSKLEFWTRPEDSNNTWDPSEDVTFLYDHKTGKGTLLWLTNHGKVRYHSETETREKIDQLLIHLDKFI